MQLSVTTQFTTGANLSPKMNNVLKILEIHPEWMEPSKAYAQTDNPMEKVVEGVAFYALGPSTKNDDSKGKYVVPANKAYFVLPKSTSGAKAAPSLDFGFEGMELVTGINGVKTSQSAQETKVYSIGGQYLGKDLNSLPNGIYIVNGEKVVK